MDSAVLENDHVLDGLGVGREVRRHGPGRTVDEVDQLEALAVFVA